jgi:hypothetical protein
MRPCLCSRKTRAWGEGAVAYAREMSLWAVTSGRGRSIIVIFFFLIFFLILNGLLFYVLTFTALGGLLYSYKHFVVFYGVTMKRVPIIYEGHLRRFSPRSSMSRYGISVYGC